MTCIQVIAQLAIGAIRPITSALLHLLVIGPHRSGRLDLVLNGPSKKAVRVAFVLQMLDKLPGDCPTRRLRNDRYHLVGVLHACRCARSACRYGASES